MGKFLVELRKKGLPNSVGCKAANLGCLQTNKFRIPRTWVITWEAYEQFLGGDPSLSEQLRAELREEINPRKPYAVRSSANLEDAQCDSFAGQFKTVLDVQGVEAVVAAVRTIWEETRSENVLSYMNRKKIPPESLMMAVIVQEMVKPAFSGVVFSRNPMTGANEIVVEAVEGLGTALVQDGKTPERWIRQGGSWIARPDESQIPAAVIQQVVDGAKRISSLLKKPLDLEWVYDGSEVYWVQMREITALNQVNVYTNRLSKEMMPGIIKPLIWSINVPLMNSNWISLLDELVGCTGLQPFDLARQFYYRSYFNMGAIGRVFNRAGFPSEGIEMMMGVVPRQGGRPVFKPGMRSLALLPRVVSFVLKKWNFSSQIEKELPRIKAGLESIPLAPAVNMLETELIEQIDALYGWVHEIAYYNIVVPILVSMLSRMMGQGLRKAGVDPLQVKLTDGMPELENYNPSVALGELNRMATRVDPALRERLSSISYVEFQTLPGIPEFQRAVADFLKRFGHLSNNTNNFSAAPWREQPELILRLIQEYGTAEGKTDAQISYTRLPLKGASKAWTLYLIHRIRPLILYREQISTLYTYGYGLFRPYFYALAGRLVQRGTLDEVHDIFYLRWEEIKQAVQAHAGADFHDLVKLRRNEINQAAEINLPDVIYGEKEPPILSGVRKQLSGTPSSRGYYTGPARVICGIEDFARLHDGDVLVVPYSDVGWSPLFARAGAVIAETGGMLSHSSIIAREYGIPAVVSVAGAGQLKDGQMVSVDGYRGVIMILDSASDEALTVDINRSEAYAGA